MRWRQKRKKPAAGWNMLASWTVGWVLSSSQVSLSLYSKFWGPQQIQFTTCCRPLMLDPATNSFLLSSKGESSNESPKDLNEAIHHHYSSNPITSSHEGRCYRAFHEAEHRTREKFYSVVLGRATERFHEIVQKGSLRKQIYTTLNRVWSRVWEIGRRTRRGIRAMSRSTFGASERMSTRILEQAVERTTERSSYASARDLFRRLLPRQQATCTSHLVGRYAETGGEHVALRVVERSPKRISIRFAKGLMIALPVVGSIFAFHLLVQDIDRFRQEKSDHGSGTAALAFFIGAAAADLFDVFLHFFIAFSLVFHLRRHALAFAEEISIGCAAISTACAVSGEIISFHRVIKEPQTHDSHA
jgi:hypothetical protein